MNNIDIRYIIQNTPFNGFGVFAIWDQKENRIMCSTHVRKDAGLIAGLLNRAWEDIENENNAIEMGG